MTSATWELLSYSFLISETKIYGPFQHWFPLSLSTVAWLLVLMETVKTSRKTIFMRKLTPQSKHTHISWKERPSFSFARAVVPWLLLRTESGQGGHLALLEVNGIVFGGSWPPLAPYPQELRATLRISKLSPTGTPLWFYHRAWECMKGMKTLKPLAQFWHTVCVQTVLSLGPPCPIGTN